MKSRFLFPNQFKLLGWLLAIPGFVLGYFVLYHEYKIPGFELVIRHQDGLFISAVENFTNELALAMIVLGLLFIAFSKEKKEDELTARMRYNALYWAILINYLIYGIWLTATIIRAVFFPDIRVIGEFTDVLATTIYNLFTPLVIFVVRYYYLRYSKNGEYKVGKLFYMPYKPYKIIGRLVSVIILTMLLVIFIIKWFFKEDIKGLDPLFDLFVFLPLSLLMWAYSREKNEDEFVATLRLESMQLAVYINYAILLVANCCLFFTGFLMFMFINLATIAFFFVMRFNYILWKYNKEAEQGELAS